MVDASVLVEMVIDGRHRQGADALLRRYAATPRLTLVSAAHGLIEALSALRRLTQRGQLRAEDGDTAVEWLHALDLVLDATGPRAQQIWQLRETMTAYDAAYAAGAQALDIPLITADERLRRACNATGIAAAHLDDIDAPH